MAQPTLVIGLGGTGHQVVLHVKKDLLDAFGKIPREVQLRVYDTVETNKLTLGGWGQSQPGSQTGTIRLGTSEYWHIGGDAYEWAKTIRDDKNGTHAHLRSWLQAPWFLAQQGSRALLNLQEGAGQFRQLGRLAVFYNLTQVRSTLIDSLTAAINTIRTAAGGRSGLWVLMAGSLTGGTGAGMFIDVAHLVRAIAESLGMPAKIRGYLVLPQAFDGTVPATPSDRNAFRARAFSAMRENRRFSATFDYTQGYPMFYAPPGPRADDIKRGFLRSTLFEFLYYFDGKRSQNSLDQVKVNEGVAPTIAEVMTAMIDDQTGATLADHAANVTAARVARQLPADTVTVSAVGTYSWVLPIYDIIEGWTHDLALEVLQLFLPPKDERSREPADDQAGNRPGLTGLEEGNNFWARPTIGEIQPGSLQRELGRSGMEWVKGGAAREQEVNNKIEKRSLGEWLQLLTPVVSVNEEANRERQEAETVLNKFLHPQRIQSGGGKFFGKTYRHAEVSLARGDEKKDPRVAAQRVEQQVTQFLTAHLGASGRGGERSGGEYHRVLENYAKWQVGRFRETLHELTRQILMGTAGDTRENAVTNKAGKLGHAEATLRAIANHLDGARQAIEAAREQRQKMAKRQTVGERIKRTLDEMNKRWQGGEAYLKAQQELLEIDRWDLAARVARDTAAEMHQYTRRLQETARAWVQALAVDSQSLLAAVSQGQIRVENDRTQADTLRAVRNIVRDKAYEDEQYKEHIRGHGQNVVAEVLNDLKWGFEAKEERDPTTRAWQPYLDLTLQIRNGEEGPAQVLACQPVSSNVERFLARCQKVFDPAREAESISKYLMWKYNDNTEDLKPEKLADDIRLKNGPLLEHGGGAYEVPIYNYLRYFRDPHLQGQQEFFAKVLAKLAGDTGVQEQAAAQQVESADRFRMTFLYHNELIDLDTVRAYQEARVAYERNDKEEVRKIYHVTPAEVHATPAEIRLGKLLPHRVVLLLEDMERFNLGMLAWMYGTSADPARLIHLHSFDDENRARRTVWRLTLPPEAEERDALGRLKQPEHYYLTNPPQQPSLMRALETFCIGGADEWSQPGAGKIPLPYEKLKQNLDRIRTEERETRIRSGTLGEGSEFVGKLNTRTGVDLQRIQDYVAEFEKMQQAHQQLEKEITGLDQKAPEYESEYTFRLLLKDYLEQEIMKRRGDINRL